MHKIGLTGGIGAGKSSIAKWFSEMGIPVFDADQSVHSIFQEKDFAELIALEFGQQYQNNNKVNRVLLVK
jgi:dephospho-CoA kinase